MSRRVNQVHQELKVNVNGIEIDDIPSETLTGSYTVATDQDSEVTFTSGSTNFSVDLTFYRTSASSEGWMDYMQFNYIKKLRMGINQLLVRDLKNRGCGQCKPLYHFKCQLRYNCMGGE